MESRTAYLIVVVFVYDFVHIAKTEYGMYTFKTLNMMHLYIEYLNKYT